MSNSLRELRLSYGLGLNQTAKRLGITPSHLSLVERYKRRGSLAFWARVEMLFNLSRDQVNSLISEADDGIRRRSNVWYACEGIDARDRWNCQKVPIKEY